MNEIDVKKELYKSKVNAKFSHYVSGNLYYTVELESGTYQFPIETIEDEFEHYILDMGDGLSVGRKRKIGIKLSEDLGTTPFYAEIKGSELNRWISNAIENEEFIKVL